VSKQLRQGVRLYQSFREKKPKLLGRFKVPTPKVAASMGYLDRIFYTTTHGGKVQPYDHKFAKGSRPLLCVSPDGKQLILLGGRFRWDRRGIVDRDAKGRAIIPKRHARNPSLDVHYRGWTLRPGYFNWKIYDQDGKYRGVTSGPTAGRSIINGELEDQARRQQAVKRAFKRPANPDDRDELLDECLQALNDARGFMYRNKKGERVRSYALAAQLDKHFAKYQPP
jgi:hypothetical protein